MSKAEKAKAEAFVRSVLTGTFGQKVSQKAIRDLATKVAKTAAVGVSDAPARKRA